MTSSQELITDTVNFSPTIDVVNESCLRRRLNTCDCTLCTENCLTQAISISKQGIYLDHDKCIGCGRCTAVCPSELFTFSGYDLYETLLAIRADDNAVISCFRHASSYPAALFIPCFATLSTEALLLISLMRKGKTYLNAINCTNCINNQYIDSLIKNIDRIEQILEDVHTLNIVAVTNEEQLPTSSGEGRRYYLKSLASDIASFAKTQHLNLFNVEKPPPPTRRVVPRKTTSLQQVLQSTRLPAAEVLLELCRPTLLIETTCTSCPRCVAMCPTGALTMSKKENHKQLAYNPDKCSSCNLCTMFCKEGALKLTQAPLLNDKPVSPKDDNN